MADATDFSESPASALSNLTLRVQIDGQRAEEKYLQHGLTLGRLESSAVYINHPDVERLHARVHQQRDGTMLLECCEQRLRIKTSDGVEVHSLALKPGIAFRLGNAVIRCARRDVAVGIDPWKVFCPLCHANLADLSHDADRCPACGREIAYFPSSQDGKRPQGADDGGFEGWIPRSVGPYRGLKFVAHGGMGIVLFGLHEASPEPAAVKLIKRSFEQSQRWQDRFRQEIAILKPLRHPNIVRFREDGIDDKLLWLATDWVAGEPLSEYILRHRRERQPVPTEEAMSILSQVAAGLQYLHGIPVVHRDLKPSNVLLGRDGGAELVDLGIARALGTQASQSTRLTHTSAVLGTAHYMSPEQQEGRDANSASDIYSFGMMAFELFAGCRPSFRTKLPDACAESCRSIIARCLEEAAEDRPAAAELVRTLSGESVRMPEPNLVRSQDRPLARPGTQSRSRIVSARRVALSVLIGFLMSIAAICVCGTRARQARAEANALHSDAVAAQQDELEWKRHLAEFDGGHFDEIYPELNLENHRVWRWYSSEHGDRWSGGNAQIDSSEFDRYRQDYANDVNWRYQYESDEWKLCDERYQRERYYLGASAALLAMAYLLFCKWLHTSWSLLPLHAQVPSPATA